MKLVDPGTYGELTDDALLSEISRLETLLVVFDFFYVRTERALAAAEAEGLEVCLPKRRRESFRTGTAAHSEVRRRLRVANDEWVARVNQALTTSQGEIT